MKQNHCWTSGKLSFFILGKTIGIMELYLGFQVKNDDFFYFFNVKINFDSHLTENMSDIQKDFSRGTLLKINLNLS